MNQHDNQIHLEDVESIVCTTIRGRLDAIQSETLEHTLAPVLTNQLHLLIDLSGCHYIASTGIRILMKAHKAIHAKEGGRMIIAQPTSEVMQVFEMAGLDQVFDILSSKEEALSALLSHIRSIQPAIEKTVGHWRFTIHRPEHLAHTATTWKNEGIAGYDELGLAVGKGYSAELSGQQEPPPGWFISIGHAAAFLPANSSSEADFRVSADPMRAGIVVDEAISFADDPCLFLQLANKTQITWQELLASVETIVAESVDDPACALVVVADLDSQDPSVCIALLSLGHAHPGPRAGQPLFLNASSHQRAGNLVAGVEFRLDIPAASTKKSPLNECLRQAIGLESLVAVGPIAADKMWHTPAIWVCIADTLEDAGKRRTAIIAGQDFHQAIHKPFLARRLYKDSSRVELKPLHGGFSAQTYHATSFDMENRKLRPTVMKIAHRDLIDREASRCKQYALPYIMNNSAMVLGTEFMGKTGALRYNFVGIGGENARLKWLTDYYKNWPVEELQPLFDKIFNQILHPWYGQPVQQTIFPFLDHDPTKTFFPHIFEEAEKLLGVSADDPKILLEQTGQTLTNPYWFLKHQYPLRCDWPLDYYVSVCHGDLNMQNILLDESMNVYLIDFSETRPRSVASDFARLEAIFMVEQTPLHTPEGFDHTVQVLKKMYGVDVLDEVPVFDPIHDDTLAKSVAMTLTMRRYACTHASGFTNPVPYYIALLEWLLPVVCYTVDLHRKKASMIAASMVCHALTRLID